MTLLCHQLRPIDCGRMYCQPGPSLFRSSQSTCVDDDIIRERPPIDIDQVINMFEHYTNDLDATVHVVDAYANEYYVDEDKVDNIFFEDSFVATREDLNNIFMILKPKRTHRT